MPTFFRALSEKSKYIDKIRLENLTSLIIIVKYHT